MLAIPNTGLPQDGLLGVLGRRKLHCHKLGVSEAGRGGN